MNAKEQFVLPKKKSTHPLEMRWIYIQALTRSKNFFGRKN